MAQRYAAFLSYAHSYGPWVAALQKNLEACLEAAGRPGKVFLDETDLSSGRSWVAQLQTGLSQSDQFVLVATPEALASPRVADEWQSFIATRRDWLAEGHLHVVELIETPLPPFLEPVQRLDFREAGEDRYRRELAKLVAGLLGRQSSRNLPTLPPGLTLPSLPEPGLPPALRKNLVDWLAVALAEKALRLAVASCLDLNPATLEGYGSWHSAASAALVRATGDDPPIAAALRIVDTLSETFDEEERVQVSRLLPLRQKLAALRKEGPQRRLLHLWLGQVAKEHGRLVPYFERQGGIDLLDRVYVQLKLQPETLRAARTGLAPEPLGRALELREALALRQTEHPWVTHRWVLLGDPGAGKTTLLRHLAATLAQEENRPWVPLYESLARLVREGRPLLDRAVHPLALAGHPAQELRALLEREAEQGRLLLLLDGLDEVPQELQEDAQRILLLLEGTWPQTPIVVTSRPIGYRSPGNGFRELHLLPLDHERRLELLARWLGSGSGVPDQAAARRALATVDSPELRELAGNPLYLTLMALLFRQNITPNRNRTRLYDQVFALLFEGGHRWHRTEPLEHAQAVRELLGRLALGMTEDHRDAEPVAALEARLYRAELDRLRETLERVPRWRGRMHQLLEEVADRTGILGPYDGDDADWRFWHRTFREALAAERLDAEYLAPGGRAAVLERARAITAQEDLGRWAEPFALLVGRVGEPDELVQTLVQENRPLGLRALATAQNLKEATLRKVLSLTENGEERRKIYSRVPELVGEPGRALRLLDQLRQTTRNGNDLFFLDLAVEEVARRSPEHTKEAQELRARLYDHIPQPAEELFRYIDTPVDGPVALWRRIPAGRFAMGSQRGKGDAAEYPCHEVTIERAFCCAAVPVTQGQYAAFADRRPLREQRGAQTAELPYHPVVSITWYEAVSFCRWLASVFPWARGARLPTEAEWEYLCRAGTKTRYWSGDSEEDLARVGWYRDNSGDRTHRVGEKPASPSPWSLYDMHGNVWEWVLDAWTRNYDDCKTGLSLDPAAVDFDAAAREAPGGGGRVIRGGCCWNLPDQVRAAYRIWRFPGNEDWNMGFRVVLPAVPEFSVEELIS